MKVTNKLPNATQNAEAGKASKTGKASSPESLLDTKENNISSADLASSSRVELSSRAQDIKKAKELASPGDSIDEAKVARLQAMIDSGKYKVDAEAVADRLLDEHMKMPM